MSSPEAIIMEEQYKNTRIKQMEVNNTTNEDTRAYHVGSSNYSKFKIQPWAIWEEYNLNPWDADIVKRVLRTKDIVGKTPIEARIEDYEKIIHVCKERLRQLNA